ncbi:hypothetical protein KY343_03450 [Candidatus Woesearchaeota archaeon]|nr:hypothetical protein [Candidatus Woesearchaeota archaeon]
MESFFRIRKSKKGIQEAGAMAAAALIIVITLLIVGYILFLPPAEREKLLSEGDEDENATEEEIIEIVLSETPERIYPLTQREFEQELPSVNIFIKEEATELKKVDSLFTSRSLFSDKNAVVEFEIVDVEDIKNVLLNFVVQESEGRLIIKLNNIEIYNREITTANIQPIELKEGLIEGTNVLEFSVSSPGATFWRTNKYALEDILITGSVVDREAQESKLTFMVSQTERENLKKVKLHFFTDCDLDSVGKLEIWINNYNLYSAIPDCGSPNRPIEFSPDKLVPGENQLIFKTEKGSYLIDHIRLTSELERVEAKTYYFTIDQEEFDDIEDGYLDATLYIRFIDDETPKEARILVNGLAFGLDQTDIEFEKVINTYIVKGNNALKIEPDEAIDVAELEVRLE